MRHSRSASRELTHCRVDPREAQRLMSFRSSLRTSTQEYQARIKVIGCGGSGGNAVNTMINFGLEGVEFIVVNTDAQALNGNAAPTQAQHRRRRSRAASAPARIPERGRKAALEDVQRIKELISGADMVFVTAGMGGGTGTGAAPVIAQLAREEGAPHRRRRHQALPLRGTPARRAAPSSASRSSPSTSTRSSRSRTRSSSCSATRTSPSSTRSARRTRSSSRPSRASATSSRRTASSTSTSPT